MKVVELLTALDVPVKAGCVEDFEVRGLSCNSKEVGQDFVFVAVRGACEDGNKFIEEAIERGAVCIVKERSVGRGKNDERRTTNDERRITTVKVKDARRALAKLAAKFYGRPSAKINVVGVTGTNGKTTVTYLIEALLKKARREPAVIGTVNYRFKDRIIPSKNTTPGPLQLQGLLAQMLSQGVDYTVMEVSSHALDQERTTGINFTSAIFTNLSQDHLDYHKNLKDYFWAKAKLFQNLNSGAFAVLNDDDEYGRRLKNLTRAGVIGYGIKSKSQVNAKEIKYSPEGTSFLLWLEKIKMEINTRLIGAHNVYNILAAAAWGYKTKIAPELIQETIKEFNFLPGRLERVDGTGKFRVFVDYAHTPDALKNIITALKNLTDRRVIAVFGCGGERDKTKRPKMGSIVTRLADYAIVTSDNPRSEDPRQIIKEIEKGIRSKNYCVIPERAEAIEKALVSAQAGDIVLIAGKGHEDYQVLKDRVIHFDDREVVRECLKSMN